MTIEATKEIHKPVSKTITCPHCNETLENVTPLEFGRHVRFCPKNKKEAVESPFPDVTVCGIRYSHPKSELKAIRMKCIDCSAGSTNEVEHCPVIECPLWTRRFNMTPRTALRKGRNVVEN